MGGRVRLHCPWSEPRRPHWATALPCGHTGWCVLGQTAPSPATASSDHPRHWHQATCGPLRLTPQWQIPTQTSYRAVFLG